MLYATHLLGSSDRAADVVQETFFRLCRTGRSSVDGHLTQWLYTVCRHCATDVLRKGKRMPPPPPEVLAAEAERSATHRPDVIAENRESHERVLAALTHLPANQQEVVRLRFQHGLSYKQIAEVTEHTVTNVGFMLHTALKTVRETLSLR
jgi:RNA polymerase sigma-70 factor (ECF subfamily)